MAYNLGAKRVVLARELTLTDIAQIRDNTPPELELEAFVHGAMCMSVSGRCLLSSYMTGRSGNRGEYFYAKTADEHHQNCIIAGWG